MGDRSLGQAIPTDVHTRKDTVCSVAMKQTGGHLSSKEQQILKVKGSGGLKSRGPSQGAQGFPEMDGYPVAL